MRNQRHDPNGVNNQERVFHIPEVLPRQRPSFGEVAVVHGARKLFDGRQKRTPGGSSCQDQEQWTDDRARTKEDTAPDRGHRPEGAAKNVHTAHDHRHQPIAFIGEKRKAGEHADTERTERMVALVQTEPERKQQDGHRRVVRIKVLRVRHHRARGKRQKRGEKGFTLRRSRSDG